MSESTMGSVGSTEVEPGHAGAEDRATLRTCSECRACYRPREHPEGCPYCTRHPSNLSRPQPPGPRLIGVLKRLVLGDD